MAWRCRYCGEEHDSGGSLRRHMREEHGHTSTRRQPEPEAVPDTEAEPVAEFAAPRARKTAGKRRTRKAGGPPVNEQIAILYRLVGQVAASRGWPQTGAVVQAKSNEAGQAWDAVVKRFPALYEMLQKGMIAGDVVALIWVHMEIVQVARVEAEHKAMLRGEPPASAA